MNPLWLSARNSRSFPFHPFRALTLVLGLGLLGCSELVDTAGPADAGVEAVVSQQSGGQGSIAVEVRQGNQRFKDVLVTLVREEKGPFDDAGSLLKQLTLADGIATFQNLPLGGYCAHITAVSSLDDATASQGEVQDLVVPVAEQEGTTVNIAPGITERQGGGGNVRKVAFTEENYVKNCVEADPFPIVLTENRPSASVRMPPGEGARLETEFVDLSGIPVGVAGWLVVGRTDAAWRSHFGWLPGDVPPDIHPGILVSVGGQLSSNGKASFKGLPPGQQVALEALKDGGPGQGLLVATGSGDLSDLESFALEPLMCELDNTKKAQPGTATGGALEIVGNVKDGFRANAEFLAVRKLSIWYEVVGDGDDNLRLRFKSTGGATQNLNIRYSCSGGDCQVGAPSGSASGTVQFPENSPFQRDLGDGRIMLTWLFDTLPFGENLASVEYQLRDFPEASKEDQTRAFSPVKFPDVGFGSQCEIDQSNDPAWWIGT